MIMQIIIIINIIIRLKEEMEEYKYDYDYSDDDYERNVIKIKSKWFYFFPENWKTISILSSGLFFFFWRVPVTNIVVTFRYYFHSMFLLFLYCHLSDIFYLNILDVFLYFIHNSFLFGFLRVVLSIISIIYVL